MQSSTAPQAPSAFSRWAARLSFRMDSSRAAKIARGLTYELHLTSPASLFKAVLKSDSDKTKQFFDGIKHYGRAASEGRLPHAYLTKVVIPTLAAGIRGDLDPVYQTDNGPRKLDLNKRASYEALIELVATSPIAAQQFAQSPVVVNALELELQHPHDYRDAFKALQTLAATDGPGNLAATSRFRIGHLASALQPDQITTSDLQRLADNVSIVQNAEDRRKLGHTATIIISQPGAETFENRHRSMAAIKILGELVKLREIDRSDAELSLDFLAVHAVDGPLEKRVAAVAAIGDFGLQGIRFPGERGLQAILKSAQGSEYPPLQGAARAMEQKLMAPLVTSKEPPPATQAFGWDR